MTVGSLFAGIGGFDLGFERAGFEIKWQVEIDPFCRKVLEKHWPAVRRYEDVRTVGAELVPVDVICAGFPCQDISSNNQYKRGIGGAKSGLWSEVVRVVRSSPRLKYLVLENVSDLLVRGMDVVLRDLAGLGMDAEWECLPACSFGLPQRRWRVFVVAYPRRSRLEIGDEWITDGPLAFGRLDGDGLVQAQHAAAEAASRILGMDAGLPGTVDRVNALGNSIAPKAAEWIARRIKEAEGLT